MQLLRTHGVQKDKAGKNVMTELGYNYRITDIQCALGLSQLPKLEKFINKRHLVVKWYKKELADIEGIVLPVELKDFYSAWHIYVIRVKNPQHRDALFAHLKEKGIGANFHYPAIYTHPYYRAHGYRSTSLHNADIYHDAAITLPLHPRLSKKDVTHVGTVLKAFFQNVA
jgi:perosamine synthetase